MTPTLALLAEATAEPSHTWEVLLIVVSILVSLVNGAMMWLNSRADRKEDDASEAEDANRKLTAEAVEAKLTTISTKLDLVSTEVRSIMARHDADIMRLYDRVNTHGERLASIEARHSDDGN